VNAVINIAAEMTRSAFIQLPFDLPDEGRLGVAPVKPVGPKDQEAQCQEAQCL
jgi:hypothetical protein